MNNNWYLISAYLNHFILASGLIMLFITSNSFSSSTMALQGSIMIIYGFWNALGTLNIFFRGGAVVIIMSYVSLVFIMILGFALIFYYAPFIQETTDIVPSFNALYFSIVTWTTLGYGDIQPTGYYKLVASIEAVLGYFIMGVLVAKTIFHFQEGTKKAHSKNAIAENIVSTNYKKQ